MEKIEVKDKSVDEKKEVTWTDEQKDVIESRDKNLLVSASAGSGKTTVMTERIIQLILLDKIPISDFLVLTFTKESAKDMKDKIVKKLLESNDDFVKNQVDEVPLSDITNLHSFCSTLISKYFYEVEVDPQFRVIDDTESSQLKNKAIFQLFEQLEKADDASYIELLDIFQVKRKDYKLKEIILDFHSFLSSLIDGDEWFDKITNEIYSEDTEKNICLNYIMKNAIDVTRYCVKLSDDFAQKAFDEGSQKYYNYYVDVSSKLKAVSDINDYFVNAKNLSEIKFNILTKEKDVKFAELTSEAVKLQEFIKDRLKELESSFVSSDKDEIIKRTQNAKNIVIKLNEIRKKFVSLYEKLKKENNGLDFNDLEKYALKILKNNDIVTSLKEKYRYIFVDEYQDINEVQEKIISTISSENNRFMVGDLKQSIYRFRHCDPEIFLEKYREYSDKSGLGKVIKLNANFRSDKKILKFVDRVFSGIMTENFGGIDYEKESSFVPGEKNTDNADSAVLCYINYEKEKGSSVVKEGVYSVKNHTQPDDIEQKSIFAEAEIVVKKIKTIMQEDESKYKIEEEKYNNMVKSGEDARKVKKPEKTEYSDFAILIFSRDSNISILAEILKANGIPVSADDKVDLIEKPYIQELINFMKYLFSRRDDELLFKIMKSKLFNFTDEELIKMRKVDIKVPFYQTIDCYNLLDDDDLKCKIEQFIFDCDRYLQIAGTILVKDFAKLIVRDFKLKSLNMISPDGIEINDDIDKFLTFLPNKNVNEFINEFDDFNMEIKNSCGGNAVRIMTIHSSKGLEFKYVFLVNLNKKINYDSVQGSILFNKNFGIGVNDFDRETRLKNTTAQISAIKIFEKKKIAEEKQRVLYVALTRAIRKLIVICSGENSKMNMDFPFIPTYNIDWFRRIIREELDGKHDSNLTFETYSFSKFDLTKFDVLPKLEISEQCPENFVEKKYDYDDFSSLPLKNSVSKILKMRENGEIEIKNKSNMLINSFDSAKNNGEAEVVDDFDDEYESFEKQSADDNQKYYADRGTAYHRVFQNIDFLNLNSARDQIKNIKSSLGDEMANFVDDNLVLKMLSHPFFTSLDGYKILKEREFFATVPSNIFGEKYEGGNVMMQGVIDFIAINDENIFVLDYKTGKINDEKRKKYAFQLDVYSDILARALNRKITKKLICLIDECKIIEL